MQEELPSPTLEGYSHNFQSLPSLSLAGTTYFIMECWINLFFFFFFLQVFESK